MNLLSRAIWRTLAYADIFDYPLTEGEISRFLIEVKAGLPEIGEELIKVSSQDGFFFLPGREEIIDQRKIKERSSEAKVKRSRRICPWFRLLPWVKLVGITGSLAMKNAKAEDDIDLLLIVAKDRLWLTRGILVICLRALGLYRRPEKIKDRICLNMFLDEDHLPIPPKEQNLFTAHEVCQLKPLWSKDGAYQKFISQNQWVKKYLPNWRP